jgi:hypothetical protein
MSASLRRQRALVYSYADAGTAGETDPVYLLESSGAADDAWWCSIAAPSGKEVTPAMKADHRVDAVFGFSAAVSIDEHSAIDCNGKSYLVRAVLARDYGRDDQQVLAEHDPALRLTAS